MAEIKLRKRTVYAGDVHRALLEAGWEMEQALRFVQALPKTDVAPVRHERLIETGMDEAWCSWGNCTACGGSNMMGSKYCNWCGAKLDGGAENG